MVFVIATWLNLESAFGISDVLRVNRDEPVVHVDGGGKRITWEMPASFQAWFNMMHFTWGDLRISLHRQVIFWEVVSQTEASIY